MHTHVGHLCRPVISMDMDMPVHEIIKNTSWEEISSVVVVDKDKKVIGIITEKDILHVESLGVKPDNLVASDICSRDIVKISPEDSIIGAAHLMIEHHVHHVLIMVGDYVEGIISTLDVLEQLLDDE